MMKEHLIVGGIYFMLPIYILWISVILISILNAYQVMQKKGNMQTLQKRNNLVLFLGSFAFLIGILGQTIGLLNAFGAIQQAGDISPALIFGGIRVAMLAPTYGFVLFIISLIVWFLNKNYWIKNN